MTRGRKSSVRNKWDAKALLGDSGKNLSDLVLVRKEAEFKSEIIQYTSLLFPTFHEGRDLSFIPSDAFETDKKTQNHVTAEADASFRPCYTLSLIHI